MARHRKRPTFHKTHKTVSLCFDGNEEGIFYSTHMAALHRTTRCFQLLKYLVK